VKILLLQENAKAAEAILFALEGMYGASVDVSPTIAQGVQRLTQGLTYALIIHDAQGATPDQFKALLSANQNSTPVLLCTQGETGTSSYLDVNIVGAIDRTALLENLLKAVEGLIEKGTLPKPDRDSEFCRIRTRLLLSFCPLKGDIYIRINEWKFIKLFHKGDEFNMADMEKYTIKRGVEYLYLRKNEVGEFMAKYAADLRSALGASNLSIEAVSRSAQTAHETVAELGRRVGFTPEVQELAKAQIQMTMKAMGRSPRLQDLIDRVKNSRGDYIAHHSTMTAYFACAIASQMQWGSELTFFKLNLASFLHDITLHNQELAACSSLTDLTQPDAKFTEAEKRAFRDHPVKGAEAARQFSEVPADVDTIILQHHEHPEGTGFPRGITATYIAPLTAVFILAHELTSYSFEKGPYFDLAEFILGAKDRYKHSQFKKVIAAMELL
jgi:hypothetical protein